VAKLDDYIVTCFHILGHCGESAFASETSSGTARYGIVDDGQADEIRKRCPPTFKYSQHELFDGFSRIMPSVPSLFPVATIVESPARKMVCAEAKVATAVMAAQRYFREMECIVGLLAWGT
jgi:hypothetical protein